MKTSLREQIYKKFRFYWKERGNPWINGSSVERYALEQGFKPSNASRRLRELAEEGLLERLEEKSVSYRYKPTEHEIIRLKMREKLNI